MNYKNYTTLTINDNQLQGNAIVDFCFQQQEEYFKAIGFFMQEWLNDSPTITLQTSGSTGNPKLIEVLKEQMLASAAMTAKYFQFQKNQTALLCLPTQYIAAKMMIVRALYSQLNLICIKPSSNPLQNLPKNKIIDFAPLTPMQLNNVNSTIGIKKILLGGSTISKELEKNLQNFSAEVYHSYGMTETLSHIAIRKLNGKNVSKYFEALDGVSFTKDERDCLIIKVSFLSSAIITNDVIDLKDEHTFIWKGRWDNVINSGGVKLFPEQIEQQLHQFIKDLFFVFGKNDALLGEKLCLVIEAEKYSTEKLNMLQENIQTALKKYEQPKEIFFIKHFPKTASEKIQRSNVIALLKNNTTL